MPSRPSVRDCRRRIVEQSRLEVGIAPGPGNNPATDVRPDLRLVRFDDPIERLGIDVTLLDQNRLERPDAELQLRELRAVAVVVTMRRHAGNVIEGGVTYFAAMSSASDEAR